MWIPDRVLVVGIYEELCANAATETLGLLAQLEVLEEPIVDELSLNVSTAVDGSTVLTPTDTLASDTPLHRRHTAWAENLCVCV